MLEATFGGRGGGGGACWRYQWRGRGGGGGMLDVTMGGGRLPGVTWCQGALMYSHA